MIPSAAAERYHDFQISRLAEAGVDLLSALTLPALSEALGIARAIARTGVPYILSFVIRPRGTLLDGTPLGDAIGLIDDTVWPPPIGYMVNCVHPSVLHAALSGSTPNVKARLLGCQANSSRLSPEELDNRVELDAESPDLVADALWSLHTEHGARILGGCCGTDDRYIQALDNRVTCTA